MNADIAAIARHPGWAALRRELDVDLRNLTTTLKRDSSVLPQWQALCIVIDKLDALINKTMEEVAEMEAQGDVLYTGQRSS